MENLENYECSYTVKDRASGNLVQGVCHCKNVPWLCKKFDDLKRKLKNELKLTYGNKCAFCQRSMSDDENIVIDIEHVLPKGNEYYINYSFERRNLVVSCRRCNTGSQKGNRTDFIVNLIQNSIYDECVDFSLSNYLFIHPGLESTYDFYKLISLQVGEDVFRRYKLVQYHDKLRYTFKFFNLKKLEIGTLDACSGFPRHILNRMKKERFAEFPVTI